MYVISWILRTCLYVRFMCTFYVKSVSFGVRLLEDQVEWLKKKSIEWGTGSLSLTLRLILRICMNELEAILDQYARDYLRRQI